MVHHAGLPRSLRAAVTERRARGRLWRLRRGDLRRLPSGASVCCLLPLLRLTMMPAPLLCSVAQAGTILSRRLCRTWHSPGCCR